MTAIAFGDRRSIHSVVVIGWPVWGSVPSAIVPVVHVSFMALAVIGLATLGASPRVGAVVIAAAVAGFAVFTSLRVVRAVLREGAERWSFLSAFVVAAFLDAGRALALVSPAPHRSTQSRQTVAAS